MIVHTMTPAEVIAEAIRDLPAVWNKLREPIERLKRNVKLNKRLLGKEQLIEYRSHAGNNWVIVVRPTKKVISISPFVYYWCSDRKLRAARVCDQGISYHFSHHVLDQYFNRFNKSEGQLERFKEFIAENVDMGVEHCEELGELRVGVRHGYITGVWLEKEKSVQLTTFVDHGKLFPEQLEQMERLDQQRYEHAHPGRRPPPGYASPYPNGNAPRVGR